WIPNIEASSTEAGTAFVPVDNHRLDDFAPHLYETRDYGETWRDLSEGLPQDDYVKEVRQHPDNPDLLFVGMERGIVVSLDRGRTWTSLRNNLPPVSVRGIRIQPQYNDLVVGTHGRGAWIMDDIQPLVELADAMEEDVHLFRMRTATDWEMWSRGSSLGQSRFQGENPEPGAWVNYWLSEGAAAALDDGSADEGAEGVTIRITDAGGTLVRELTDPEAHAGVNRAVWDLQWAGPDGDREGGGGRGGGGGGRGGGPSGPPASPGRYTATLVVAGQELSTDFELRGDPNVGATPADYDARFAAAQRAGELQARLTGMIDAMEDLDQQLDGTLQAIDGKNLDNEAAIRDKVGEAKDRIGAVGDETSRPPEGMGYRDWPRLLEQLSFVARGITGAQARPTRGQLEVLDLIEEATGRREAELTDIIETVIGDLNRMLEDQPRVLTSWQGGRIIS
ncbi:MAG TPA: hypothetical protein VE173_06035, partial [Longimicrobiales bacterium]|nr:hypothetical protein [Longimicrobiales bacterium]